MHRILLRRFLVDARHGDWVVLRDPAGLPFCVVPGEGDDFLRQAKRVGA